MKRKQIVVFTGSGVSAPSGLATFRDPDGIWSRYRVEDVATPQAWAKDPAKVLHFYNLRRTQLGTVLPNPAHRALARLEQKHEVTVITQNVDNLHERAGSSRVLHLHGELTKVRSTRYSSEVLDVGYNEVTFGDRCSRGAQLRPHVVWFGEQIFHTDEALWLFRNCDMVIIAGTSLTVYPAAALAMEAPAGAQRYLVDLHSPAIPHGFTFLQGSADLVLPQLVSSLLHEGQ